MATWYTEQNHIDGGWTVIEERNDGTILRIVNFQDKELAEETVLRIQEKFQEVMGSNS